MVEVEYYMLYALIFKDVERFSTRTWSKVSKSTDRIRLGLQRIKIEKGVFPSANN